MKVTVVQLNSQEDIDSNLRTAERLIRTAHAEGASGLYVLPEYAPFGGGTIKQKFDAAEDIPTGRASTFYRNLARELGAAIHCGTINEKNGPKMFNTSVIFDRSGGEICRYRKLHLFDARLPSGREILESKLYDAGNEIAAYALGDITVGCATCYDVRFPAHFQALRRRGANAFAFVAAMSKEHGEAHLEVLLRARAIENQAYIFAAQQCGKYFSNTRENFGNSMIIDPWGNVVARLGNEPGFISHVLDVELVNQVRTRVPLFDLDGRVEEAEMQIEQQKRA